MTGCCDVCGSQQCYCDEIAEYRCTEAESKDDAAEWELLDAIDEYDGSEASRASLRQQARILVQTCDAALREWDRFKRLHGKAIRVIRLLVSQRMLQFAATLPISVRSEGIAALTSNVVSAVLQGDSGEVAARFAALLSHHRASLAEVQAEVARLEQERRLWMDATACQSPAEAAADSKRIAAEVGRLRLALQWISGMLVDRTDVSPTSMTPNERAFCKAFGRCIALATEALRPGHETAPGPGAGEKEP